MDKYCENLVSRNCVICGGVDFIQVSTLMKSGPQLVTVICKKCSLVFTNPVPSQEVYYSFYSTDYEQYYGKTTAKRPNVSSQPAIFSTLAKLIDMPSSDYLEIGPGRGITLYHANQLFRKTLGVEPSIDFTNLLVNELQLNIVHKTFEDFISGYKDQVNVVSMFHVLEHMYDPYDCLTKIRGILKKDGLLVIEVPNILKPFKNLDSYFLRFVHLFNFSPLTLKTLLIKSGFEVVYVNEGGEDWGTPQHLLMVVKVSNIETLVNADSQEADKVINILDQYRTQFTTSLRYKWWTYNINRFAAKMSGKIRYKSKVMVQKIFRVSSVL